jgi:hypothetical protein
MTVEVLFVSAARKLHVLGGMFQTRKLILANILETKLWPSASKNTSAIILILPTVVCAQRARSVGCRFRQELTRTRKSVLLQRRKSSAYRMGRRGVTHCPERSERSAARSCKIELSRFVGQCEIQTHITIVAMHLCLRVLVLSKESRRSWIVLSRYHTIPWCCWQYCGAKGVNRITPRGQQNIPSDGLMRIEYTTGQKRAGSLSLADLERAISEFLAESICSTESLAAPDAESYLLTVTTRSKKCAVRWGAVFTDSSTFAESKDETIVKARRWYSRLEQMAERAAVSDSQRK